MMIRLSLIEDFSGNAMERSCQTAIEAKCDDLARSVRPASWPNVFEAGKNGGTNGVEVADYRSGPFQCCRNVKQLKPIEKLAV